MNLNMSRSRLRDFSNSRLRHNKHSDIQDAALSRRKEALFRKTWLGRSFGWVKKAKLQNGTWSRQWRTSWCFSMSPLS